MQSISNQIDLEEMLRQKSEEQSVLQTLVSIKDLARSRFHAPRGVTTVREALRDFKKLCETDPMISENLPDFELHVVGMFNPVDGSYLSVPASVISRGVDFKKV